MKAAALIIGACTTALVLVACTTTGEIEGHRVRGTAEPPAPTVSTDLHRNAPGWFKISWQRYLDVGGRSYGIFYADRNGRGAGSVSCNQGCQNATNPAYRAQIEVSFKHKALERCRWHVRQTYPAVRPDCALYAIKDQIVWKGPMPWE